MSSSDRQPVGWIRGPLYYLPYFGDYWYTDGFLSRANRLLADPSDFFSQASQGAVQGAIQGATSSFQKSASSEGEVPNDLESSDPPTLINRVRVFISEGAWNAAAVGLEQLLHHARTEDPSLQEAALESLNHARAEGVSLPEAAHKVWDFLNSRHIVWGGSSINFKSSSIPELRESRLEIEKAGSSLDGTSPIESLIRCQDLYQRLRTQHDLPVHCPSALSPPSESISQTDLTSSISEEGPSISREEIERLQHTTDETIHHFCEKTVHYSTMYAMHTLFSQEIPPEEFNQMIQQGGDLETRYLDRMGGGVVRRFFYKHTYRLIINLITPIIQETVEGVTTHLRDFFVKDDVEMLRFAEGKINLSSVLN